MHCMMKSFEMITVLNIIRCHNEVLPRKCTRSWELGHSFDLSCPFLDLLSDISRLMADQDVQQQIFVASEDWLVSGFTPVKNCEK